MVGVARVWTFGSSSWFLQAVRLSRPVYIQECGGSGNRSWGLRRQLDHSGTSPLSALSCSQRIHRTDICKRGESHQGLRTRDQAGLIRGSSLSGGSADTVPPQRLRLAAPSVACSPEGLVHTAPAFRAFSAALSRSWFAGPQFSRLAPGEVARWLWSRRYR